MKTQTWLAGLALAGALALPQLASAEASINIGHLQCSVAPGMGILVTSSKDLQCDFTALGGRYREHYVGTIRKFGFDLGPTNAGVLIWDVLAPSGGPPMNALAGDYIGGAASATVGVGLGANALVAVLGPHDGRSITLQPLSTQAQTGFNFAAGVANLSLRPVVDVPPPLPPHGHRRHYWK